MSVCTYACVNIYIYISLFIRVYCNIYKMWKVLEIGVPGNLGCLLDERQTLSGILTNTVIQRSPPYINERCNSPPLCQQNGTPGQACVCFWFCWRTCLSREQGSEIDGHKSMFCKETVQETQDVPRLPSLCLQLIDQLPKAAGKHDFVSFELQGLRVWGISAPCGRLLKRGPECGHESGQLVNSLNSTTRAQNPRAPTPMQSSNRQNAEDRFLRRCVRFRFQTSGMCGKKCIDEDSVFS